MIQYSFCFFPRHSGLIQRTLLTVDPKKTRYMPPESVDAIIKVCKETNGIQGEVQGGLGFIYPGTKWCGPGEFNRICIFITVILLMIHNALYASVYLCDDSATVITLNNRLFF